jgi:hypothetical protein
MKTEVQLRMFVGVSLRPHGLQVDPLLLSKVGCQVTSAALAVR